MKAKLIFVYNADGGLFNTVTDIAHKILSPATYRCDLCVLTHGYFTVREEWRRFLEGLGVECEFLHRDEARARFPDLDIPLPAVLRQTEGQVAICLDAEAIRQCATLEALQQAVIERCRGATLER